MIELYWVVALNNAVCFIAFVCCFLHALHGGLYTTGLAKVILFFLGLVFYSNIITDISHVVMPGYKYIMGINIVVGLITTTFFSLEFKRSGCLASWVQKVQLLSSLILGDTNARQKHR